MTACQQPEQPIPGGRVVQWTSRGKNHVAGDAAMFSQKVEYALRAVVHLAAKAPQAQTTEQIATATRVPPAYLAKVLQQLVHAGVLRSQRGVGGGIALVKSPGELSLLEVVSAVDPIQRIQECPLGL